MVSDDNDELYNFTGFDDNDGCSQRIMVTTRVDIMVGMRLLCEYDRVTVRKSRRKISRKKNEAS